MRRCIRGSTTQESRNDTTSCRGYTTPQNRLTQRPQSKKLLSSYMNHLSCCGNWPFIVLGPVIDCLWGTAKSIGTDRAGTRTFRLTVRCMLSKSRHRSDRLVSANRSSLRARRCVKKTHKIPNVGGLQGRPGYAQFLGAINHAGFMLPESGSEGNGGESFGA